MDHENEDINRIEHKRRFRDMTGSEKLAYLGKVFGFAATLGFLFPNIFVE